MSAGLPGVGLAGALYVVLIVWMLARELFGTAIPGRFAPQWRFIGKMIAILTAMLVALVGERLLIHSSIKFAALYVPGLEDLSKVPSGTFLLVMASIPFALLLLLMLGLQVLRLFLDRNTTSITVSGAGREDVPVPSCE